MRSLTVTDLRWYVIVCIYYADRI